MKLLRICKTLVSVKIYGKCWWTVQPTSRPWRLKASTKRVRKTASVFIISLRGRPKVIESQYATWKEAYLGNKFPQIAFLGLIWYNAKQADWFQRFLKPWPVSSLLQGGDAKGLSRYSFALTRRKLFPPLSGLISSHLFLSPFWTASESHLAVKYPRDIKHLT